MKKARRVDLTAAYEGKPDIVDICHQNRLFFAAITIVHKRGCLKYAPYSWLNTPVGHGSSLVDNINAISRHFGAHSMGRILDPEGLPHIFHMCCRVGMFVTTAYRQAIDYATRVYGTAIWTPLQQEQIHGDKLGIFLTPQEFLPFTKEEQYTLPQTLSECYPYIQGLLFDLALDPAYERDYPEYKLEGDKTPFNVHWSIDKLYLAIARFIRFWAAEHKDAMWDIATGLEEEEYTLLRPVLTSPRCSEAE